MTSGDAAYTDLMVESQRSDLAAADVFTMLSRQASELYDDSRLMPMLRQLVRSTCQITGAVGGSVSLVDSAAGRYTKIAELGTACQLGESFPIDEGVTGQVVNRRAPVILGSYRDIRTGHLKPGHAAWDGAVAAIPIWWRADIVAVNVIFVGSPRPFTTGEVDSLELVTQVVAPGLVSAVQRELPDKALTRRRDEHWLTALPAQVAPEVPSVKDVVADLVDLAQRASGGALGNHRDLQVRVVRDEDRHRLLVRSEDDLVVGRGTLRWHEVIEGSDGADAPTLAGARAGARGTGAATDAAPFTAREQEVLVLLWQGLSDRAIATRLCLSPKTVEKHVSAVLRKSGTTSRTAAVVRALDEGWLP